MLGGTKFSSCRVSLKKVSHKKVFASSSVNAHSVTKIQPLYYSYMYVDFIVVINLSRRLGLVGTKPVT